MTNRKDAGDRVIWWLRERFGKRRDVHSAMQSDLAGGQRPCGLSAATAVWWAWMILPQKPNAAMKRLVPGKDWLAKRMKALRLRLTRPPGRVVSHAGTLTVRPSA